MNSRVPIFLATAVAALAATGVAFQAAGQTQGPTRFVVVVDTSAGPQPGLIARAAASIRSAERATGAEGELRVTRTPTEQLSVTHFFAAREYDAIVGAGLDTRIAVASVKARFPDTSFRLTGASGLPAAVSAAAAGQ